MRRPETSPARRGRGTALAVEGALPPHCVPSVPSTTSWSPSPVVFATGEVWSAS